jgi:hypothetical protein
MSVGDRRRLGELERLRRAPDTDCLAHHCRVWNGGQLRHRTELYVATSGSLEPQRVRLAGLERNVVLPDHHVPWIDRPGGHLHTQPPVGTVEGATSLTHHGLRLPLSKDPFKIRSYCGSAAEVA